MYYADEITLIKRTFQMDEIGNSVPTEEEAVVYGDLRSISMTEHYAAARVNRKPDLKFVMRKHDYDNQDMAKVGNDRYTIYRTYLQTPDNIELYLEKSNGKDNKD